MDVEDLSRRLETHLLKEQVERRQRRASAQPRTTTSDRPREHLQKQRLSIHGPHRHDAPKQDLPETPALPGPASPKQDLPLRDYSKEQYRHTPQFAAVDFERTTTRKTPDLYTARRLSAMPDADTSRRLSFIPDSYTARRSSVIPDPLTVRKSSAIPEPLAARRSSIMPDPPASRRLSKPSFTQYYDQIESQGPPSPNQVIDACAAAQGEMETAAEYYEDHMIKTLADTAVLDQQRYVAKSPKPDRRSSDAHPLVARQGRPKSTGDISRDLDKIIASGQDVAFRLRPNDRHDWTQSDEGSDKPNIKKRVSSITKNWSSRRSSREIELKGEKDTTGESKTKRRSSLFGLFARGSRSSWP